MSCMCQKCWFKSLAFCSGICGVDTSHISDFVCCDNFSTRTILSFKMCSADGGKKCVFLCRLTTNVAICRYILWSCYCYQMLRCKRIICTYYWRFDADGKFHFDLRDTNILHTNLIVQIVTSLTGINNQANILMDRRFWIAIFMVTVIVPLSFMRKLDSLKYTSIISLFAVAYLCAIVIWHFASSNFVNDPAGNVEMITFSTRFFRSLPVFVFAFTCHQNVCVSYQCHMPLI